jgi:4-diphosphocytidyl-2C-methyl-D-erythritol kinase
MAVERIEPRQGALRRRLEAAGFADVRMSGSGSTLYQVVRDGEAAEDLLDRALQCEGVREAVLAHGVGAKAS